MVQRGLRYVSLFLCLSLCLNFCFPWGVSAKAERATKARSSSVGISRGSCSDRTAPIFISGYPKVTDLQSRQVSFCLKSNERGKAYFVVVPNNAKVPTAAQVKAGKNANGQAVTPLLKGQINLCANKETSVTIKGLVANTSFDIYFTVEDRTCNLQSKVTKVDIKTKPIFLSGYPKVSNVQSNQVDLSFKINESGKLYYVVVPNNAKTPSVTQIKKGNDAYCKQLPSSLKGQICLCANKEACVTIEGLRPATAYDVYLMITDAKTGQAKSWIVKVEIATNAPVVNKEVTAVAQLNNIMVDYGTLKGAIGLPTNVTVTLNDRSTKSLAVSWDNGDPAYNGNIPGIYTFTGTLTMVDGISNARGYKASIKVNVKAAPVYTINVTGQPTFANQTEGYESVVPQRVTISKTGNSDITNLAVALSGLNADSFSVTQPIATTLNNSTPSTVFTVKPKDGLKAGKYEAVVVITADNGVRESFKVGFTVNTAKSKDARLTALAVSQGEISFNPGNLAYSVTVPNATASVGVTFTAAQGATTSVSSPQTVAITNGTGFFSVVVTAEDEVTQKTYIIKFVEALSNDATLSNLKVNGVTVAGFSPAKTTYNIEVPFGTKVGEPAVQVTATKHDAKAADPVITQAKALPGAATVLVMAEDRTTTKTYTVNFSVAPSTTKAISSFKFKSLKREVVGVIDEKGKTITLTVPYGTDVRALVPTIVHTGASVSPNSGVAQNFTNPVTYTVTAADGTTAVYTVEVIITKNTDASLTALAVSQGEISFNPGNSAYSVIVPNGTTAVKVTFTAAPGAKTSVSSPQTVAITNGIGTFAVAVTAEDGVSKKEYTIKFKEKVAAPTASPESGVVAVGTKVILTTNTTGARIYYTTDASEPTSESILYKDVILINEKTVIKAIAVKDGFPNSEVGVFSYSIQVLPITPIRDFTCTKTTDTTADFSWTAAMKAARLKVQQSTDKGETWTDANHGTLAPDATSVSVRGLTPSTSYKFKLVVTGGNNAGDSNIVDVTTVEKVKVYGVKWSYGSSTELTRIGLAEGKAPGKDFDKFAPWSGIKLCNVSDNGKITAYINDANFKRDGSNGQVMVKIPKFYYKHTYDDVNKVHEFWVAEKPAPGFKVHPCFLRDGVEKDYVLVGAYKAGFGKTQNGGLDTLTSISGISPAHSKTRAEFRTLVQARGAGWNQADALTRNAINLLYLVEYANADSQTAIGRGVVFLCSYVKSGGCDDLNGASGNADVDQDGDQDGKTGKASVSYRGMEDLWGNIWEHMDGININNKERQPYIADSNFTDDKFDGNYVPSGLILPNEHGCIMNFGYSASADWLLMPSECGENAYIPDRYYPGWWYAGDKVPYIGGIRYDAENAGMFSLFVSKTSTEATTLVGTRIQLIP